MLSVTVRFLSAALQNLVSVSERTNHLLQGVSEIGQVMSRLVQLDELFPRAVDLIRERFAFYHVQIFQVDDSREYAVLVASTGEAGKQLMSRSHRLAVGSQSVIGRVTQIGEVVIALDSDRDTVHARNELLRDTRSELAVPIIEGDRIIGALDVQSTRPNAFDAVDVQALQAMANQLASAIRTARLFEEQQDSVQENKRVLLEAEMSLREIQRLNQQLTHADWERYLDEDGRVMGVTLGAAGLEKDAEWSDDMIAASRTRQPVLRKDGERVISVPIVLRGEVLGAIEITPEDDVREADASEMIQSVAERLAISLDNARLFEEAQAATRQEQRINEIVGRYQSAATVEELLQITLTELSESLGAQQAAIRLSATPPGANGSGPSANGHRHEDAASGGDET
jgi:GAF domain-containing protein